MHLAGDLAAARVRVPHHVDGEERRLGLHVVHVGRVVDAGVAHGGAHAIGDLLDHGRPADVFGQKLGAQRRADGQAGFVGRPGLGVAGKDRRMRRDHAVAAAGPDHRNLLHRLLRAAVLAQHRAKRLIGEDAGEVVDAAIALGLADDRNDLVGAELTLLDQGLHAGSILHALQFDLGDFNGHQL